MYEPPLHRLRQETQHIRKLIYEVSIYKEIPRNSKHVSRVSTNFPFLKNCGLRFSVQISLNWGNNEKKTQYEYKFSRMALEIGHKINKESKTAAQTNSAVQWVPVFHPPWSG